MKLENKCKYENNIMISLSLHLFNSNLGQSPRGATPPTLTAPIPKI